MTYHDFEDEAREWCLTEGYDPEERIPFVNPNGYAVGRQQARWVGYAMRLADHRTMTDLVWKANCRWKSKLLQ